LATTKKRIAVSCPPELEKALNDLRDATGIAPSSFIAEIMTQSIPMIRGVTEAALELKRDPAQALRLMQRSLLEATSEVNSIQLQMLEHESVLRKTTKGTDSIGDGSTKGD